MTDVDTLLWLDHIATQLRDIQPAPTYEVAAIDPDLIRDTAADILRFDGMSWEGATIDQRVRAFALADVIITCFLERLLRSAS